MYFEIYPDELMLVYPTPILVLAVRHLWTKVDRRMS